MASVDLRRDGLCTRASALTPLEEIRRQHTAPRKDDGGIDRRNAEARCAQCPAWKACLEECYRLATEVDEFTWMDPDVIYGGLWGAGETDPRVAIFTGKKGSSRMRPLGFDGKPDLQFALDRALTLREQGVFEGVG